MPHELVGGLEIGHDTGLDDIGGQAPAAEALTGGGELDRDVAQVSLPSEMELTEKISKECSTGFMIWSMAWKAASMGPSPRQTASNFSSPRWRQMVQVAVVKLVVWTANQSSL